MYSEKCIIYIFEHGKQLNDSETDIETNDLYFKKMYSIPTVVIPSIAWIFLIACVNA